MGMDHAVVKREDGSATAISRRGNTLRRTFIRLKKARNGGLVSVQRGEHRKLIEHELGPVLAAHWIELVKAETRGLIPPESNEEIVQYVENLRSRGLRPRDAFRKLASHLSVSEKHAQNTFYKARRSLKNTMINEGHDFDDSLLVGPNLLELVRRLSRSWRITEGEAARIVSEDFGWDKAEYTSRVQGSWKHIRDENAPADHQHWKWVRQASPNE
jgi:hypothetical protein